MLALARGLPRVALLLASLALLGCVRKAPGPDECEHFATTVVMRHAPGGLMTQALQSQIEEETRNCLTRPYDRELLDCVLTTNRGRACLESFRRRSGDRGLIPMVEPG